MRFWSALVFGIIVTLAMNALDMLYHVATETAVHLNYVAVKFLIVFASVFLIALVIGRGRIPGIVTSLLGPIAFYIYYRVATPTIDRSIFTIDDAMGYVVVHVVALALVYWLAQSFVAKKDGRIAFSILVALAALPLYWGWLMLLVIAQGGLTEQTTTVLPLASALIVLAVLFVLTYLSTWVRKAWWSGILAGIVFGVIGLVAGATVITAAAQAVALAVPSILTHTTLVKA